MILVNFEFRLISPLKYFLQISIIIKLKSSVVYVGSILIIYKSVFMIPVSIDHLPNQWYHINCPVLRNRSHLFMVNLLSRLFLNTKFFVDLDQTLALQGYISLKAYRLTPAALENLKSEDYFSPDK